MLVICGDNIRMIMRKENHYICILLIGIIIRLGKDKGTNQLHLAKREIGIGRVLETGTTKKIHFAGGSSIPVHFWKLLPSSYQNLLKFPFLDVKSLLSIATSSKGASTSHPSLTSPIVQAQGPASLCFLDHLLCQQSQN